MSIHLKVTKVYILIILFSSHVINFGQNVAHNGMVVSDQQIASEVGIQILKQGGNAIDACVATAFALAVSHPQAGNIGGGGFLVFMDSTGKATTIDFREKAPLAASLNMFLDDIGNLIEGLNHEGLLSVGVPGTVAGLYLAHAKYGRLSWKKLVKPAMLLAKNGIPITNATYEWAVEINTWEAYKDIMDNYFKDKGGNIVQQNELWKQPNLAHTLKIIGNKGHKGFYNGNVARIIAKYMKQNGGIITKEDLDQYRAIERTPIHGTYKDFDIYSMPPPSSGGVVLIQLLNLMELVNIDSLEFGSDNYVHFLAESMRLAYADRAIYLGDQDFNPNMPIETLISKKYAQQQFRKIDWTKAGVSDSTIGDQISEGLNTTHISVIDEAGNAVSLTYTLEQNFGSGMGSSKLGFIFNNEMGDFNPVPGLTNHKGLIGSWPNTIQPKKRMLSSMTPTIVSKNNRPYLIIGSPGGRTIINTVFQTILNVLAYNMSIEEAIEALKIHHQWLPDQIKYEENMLSQEVINSLIAKGHQMEAVEKLGRLMGILVDSVNQTYFGAADSSSPDGGVVGY